MLRYYLISAALVVTFGVIVAALQRAGPALKVSSVQSTASPSPSRAQGTSSFAPRSPTGAAPWAMSALPECFRQRREVHGPVAFVRAEIPAGARRLPAHATLSSGDCTIVVGADSVAVQRGDETLLVPPHAELYALGTGQLALFRTDRAGAVLRFYGPGTAR